MKNRLQNSLILFSAVTFLTSLCNSVNAQKIIFLFGHAQYASPANQKFTDNYRYGLGAEAGLGVGLNKTFLVGTAGYTQFIHVADNKAGNLSYVPFKLGIRHYVISKIVYLHVDGGVANIKVKGGTPDSRFTADAGLGVKLGPLEVEAVYDGFAKKSSSIGASWFGLKAGFRFGI